MIIFGGTTGITHERNDLLVYNIEKNYWQRYWTDEQSERNEEKSVEKEIVSRSLKKLRSNSVTKKMGGSSFLNNAIPSNSKAN